MSAPFAIYVRVSEVGVRDGPGFGSPEEQEAAAREWAERAGVEVYFDPDECIDLDVSGATAIKDRRLGKLIERCESGELSGSHSELDETATGEAVPWTDGRGPVGNG